MRWTITALVLFIFTCSQQKQLNPVKVAILKWEVKKDKLPTVNGDGFVDLSGLEIIYSSKNNTNKPIKHLLIVFKITSETDTIYWDNIVRNIPAKGSKSGITLVPDDYIKDYNHLAVNTEIVKILN